MNSCSIAVLKDSRERDVCCFVAMSAALYPPGNGEFLDAKPCGDEDSLAPVNAIFIVMVLVRVLFDVFLCLGHEGE